MPTIATLPVMPKPTPLEKPAETACMKIEYRAFACPMLMQRTHVKITSSVPKTDESLNPAPEPSIELDCASKMRCGIARMDAQGNISFKWDSCPARLKWTSESRR